MRFANCQIADGYLFPQSLLRPKCSSTYYSFKYVCVSSIRVAGKYTHLRTHVHIAIVDDVGLRNAPDNPIARPSLSANERGEKSLSRTISVRSERARLHHGHVEDHAQSSITTHTQALQYNNVNSPEALPPLYSHRPAHCVSYLFGPSMW